MKEIIVDSFAGGGGASTGIEMAVGRPVDIAINHDPVAIAMHKANHPETKHYCESVWDVDPRKATEGKPVGLMWLSPDCTHFSKAKGGKPRDKTIRGLAWLAVKWARAVKPRVIILENVEEFQTWGPVLDNGQPCPERRGQTFHFFIKQLNKAGYKVDWRELRACDFGAPTTRKRLFLIARCDGGPIVWPDATHDDPESLFVKSGVLKPWHTAAECIDWSLPCPSIFERKRPLVENTLRRIARGIQKFIVENPDPFVVENRAAFLTKYHSYDDGTRGQNLDRPLLTVDTSNRFGLVTAFISKFYRSGTGQSLDEPLHTITTSAGKFAKVRVYLMTYYGNGEDWGQRLDEPLRTITTKDRFGIVTVQGQDYQIVDVGLRMLQPHELYFAQGFPPDYIFTHDVEGNPITKTQQVAKCGNAVPPPFAKALVRANLPEMCRSTKIA